MLLHVNVFAIYATSDSLVLSSANSISQTDISSAFSNSGVITSTLNTLYISPESYGYTKNQLISSKIGSPFTISDISNSGVISEDLSTFYFPLFIENEVIAIITLIKHNGKLFCNIGKDFSAGLNNALKEGRTKNIALFSDGTSIYAKSEDNINIDIFTKNDNELNRDNYTYTNLYSTYNTINQNTIFNSLYSSNSIIDTNLSRAGEYSLNYLIDYPIVGQHLNGDQLGVCWAAVIASIVSYKYNMSPNMTAFQVCDALGVPYQGATWAIIEPAYDLYFSYPYNPYKLDAILSVSYMWTLYANLDPAHMGCVSADGSSAHHVAWCGFALTNGVPTVRVMDPGYETIKIASINGSTYAFDYGGSYYLWEKTIILR